MMQKFHQCGVICSVVKAMTLIFTAKVEGNVKLLQTETILFLNSGIGEIYRYLINYFCIIKGQTQQYVSLS